MTPESNQNAAKPGSLYSQHLTADEQAIFDEIELGSLDDEIRLTKIRLARALAQEAERGGKLEVDSMVKRTGGGPQVAAAEVHTKARDYASIIDRLTARIASLEARRALIANMTLDADLKRIELKDKAGKEDGEPVGKIVIEVVKGQADA